MANIFASGNAMFVILTLQASCILQPAGSSIFECTHTWWRASPIHCVLDLTLMLYDFARLKWTFRLSTSAACHAICRIRHRITAPSKHGVVRSDYPCLGPFGLRTPQPIASLFASRDTTHSIVVALNVLQYIKIMTVRGPSESVGLDQLLATIYMLYWIANEILAAIIWLKPLEHAPKNGDRPFVMALFVDAAWFTKRYQTRQRDLVAMRCAMISALLFMRTKAGITDFNELFTGGTACNIFRGCIGVLHDMTELSLTVTFNAFLSFRQGFDLFEPPGWLGLYGVWYAIQAVQSIAFVVMFHIRVYDSSQTQRPSWTDWLG